ncbi:MAG: hypothetical protein R3B84_19170 [Zavarzinella sp.]
MNHLMNITVQASQVPKRLAEPVTRGVPIPRGKCHHPLHLELRDQQNQALPLQVKVLEQWPDGSAKWVLCDWRATISGTASWKLSVLDQPASTTTVAAPASAMNAEQLVQELGRHGVRAAYPVAYMEVKNEHGKPLKIEPTQDCVVEESGPMRICVSEVGTLSIENAVLARYHVRTHYYPGTGLAKVSLSIHNPARAAHPGGCWDLGDAGSILLKTVSVIAPFPAAQELRLSLSAESGWQTITQPALLIQNSSGGENWQSTNHITRTGTIGPQFRGYSLLVAPETNDTTASISDAKNRGHRATPIAQVVQNDRQLSLSAPYFWQTFPKGLQFGKNSLTLQLFDNGEGQPLELQGGERKSDLFWICYGPDTISEEPLAWTREPLIPTLAAEDVMHSGAESYLTPADSEAEKVYLELVSSAIEGNDTFFHKREKIDQYGWRNFGDIWGDHEAVLHQEVGPNPRISHYNNQYDCVAGFGWQWLRTGDHRWYQQMVELAYHVRDIDIYNTDEDKPAYNHGLFWHTYHYVDAGTSTHRTYPKAGVVPPKMTPIHGGGPGNEQNYPYGLMLHYLLTGDAASREAAIGLAQWVIDMDDGSKTIFRWLSKRPTGVASASRSPDYHGPGRGSGNSLAALLVGHRLTGEQKFLDKAAELIHRVIHPEDNIATIVGMMHDGKQCIDAENRWFYVMCLVSLGKFLDRKAELGQVDQDYAYARACLLHYARWMLTHEYLYLDRPEILEYPTETWAAQDQWKVEVFQYAALHAEPAEKQKFLDKAAEFYQQSLQQLQALPSRTLCRPVVLLMAHGWQRNWFARNADATRPAPVHQGKFPAKQQFVPQKAVAIKRAKLFVLASAFAGFLLLLFGLYLLFR